MRYMTTGASQMRFAVAVPWGGDATMLEEFYQEKHLFWDQLMNYSCGQDAKSANPGQERCSLQRWAAKLGVSF